MTIADFPHMKRENRTKLHKKIFAVAYPEEQKNKIITFDDLQNMGFNKTGK